MQAFTHIRFVDDFERRTFQTVMAPSVLGGPETDENGPYPRTRLVRRAGQGDSLSSSELGVLVAMLGAAIKERRCNILDARDEGNEALASGFETWLEPLDDALRLACRGHAIAIAGDAAGRTLAEVAS